LLVTFDKDKSIKSVLRADSGTVHLTKEGKLCIEFKGCSLYSVGAFADLREYIFEIQTLKADEQIGDTVK
jgi:hypothetical protein